MADLTKKEQDTVNAGCAISLIAVACILLYAVFLDSNPSMVVSSADQEYAQGYDDGVSDGKRLKRTQEYENSQIDSIVDPVVERNSARLASKGSDYKRGWVAGLKSGMYRTRADRDT